MRGRRGVYLRFGLAAMCIYIVLLLILYFSEAADGSATIHTLGDAFWYSLVTLTTVGYGDMTPVTPYGQLVGVVFLILAAGIMMTLIGAAVSFVTSEIVPLFMLGFQRKRNWYYFADCGAEADVLAADIIREDPEAVIIYGERKNESGEIPNYPCLYLNTSLSQIVSRKNNVGTKCKVFVMEENGIGVNRRINRVHMLPVDVYARTTNGRDKLSGNVTFFHSHDCCARQYWLSRPLCAKENTIVIIGFGNYGWSILERAILTNVISTSQHVAYHIFGNAEEFLALHDRLHEVFSLNQESDVQDSLIFHKKFWGKQREVLERADRIIICEDDEQEGWNIFWNLSRYYKIRGRIDLRSSRMAPGVSYFGTNEEIYTLRQIIRADLNHAAVVINDLFCKSVSYPTLGWDELDDFHKQSKIVAADHLLMKIRILLENEKITELSGPVAEMAYHKYCETKSSETAREEYRRLEHMRWLRFYIYHNWSWGPVRNDEERQHPMLCEYERLTPEQKKERDASWELLGLIFAELGEDSAG